MKLSELFKLIASQSGVAADDAGLKTILENTAISSLEVDDAVSTRLTAPRMTIDAAKNNPDLKKYFFAQSLDGIDAEVTRTMAELGLPEEAVTEIKGLEKTSHRVSALAKKVQALESAKVGASAGDKTKLAQDVTKLNEQIVALNNTYAAEKAALQSSFESERIDWNVDNILSGYKYSTPVDLDVNVLTAKTLLNKSLQEKGLKIVKKDGNLSLQTSEGTAYFEDNVKVGIKDFASKTLANAKMLSGSAGSSNQDQSQDRLIQRSTQNDNGIDKTKVNTSEWDRVMDTTLADAAKHK
jgi:hypothetical protein